MLRLAERPADVVLADTALTRPDSVGFVRRVLARAPQAAVLLLGAEESEAAAATIGAGARGLIQGVDQDLTSAVAKALLLLAAPGRANRHRIADPARGVAGGGPAVVPVQRGDDPAESGAESEPDKPASAARADRSAIGLTERELQVLLGMAEGKSNAEIGRELFVSEDTVKTHARRLFRKLGARDRAHAVAAGFRAGLVA
ncbi:helix-turn-helix transcriptional regulator [Verrucosispora sioxanthis]|uniref:helix-turn-helix transcriptional regulator n=1 Tax=Verrucosispora sioxanthis TaxID=2499994 RepID=UPI001C1253BB|nr:helix-turn-helix transcriptional regulator [Verrucosispora sioxanthis]